MPVSYEDALTRWDRSKAFGDPRDFSTFANDMESLQPGQGFGEAANRDGWWTRASTRADQSFFHPLADVTTAPIGAGIGSLFGGKGEEIGRNVGRSIPRMVAQTLPLVAAEIFSGGAATPFVLPAAAATTGGLFGAQTYAETGSPTAAAISGVTAAALPAVGRVAGPLLPRALGLAERFGGGELATEEGSRFVPPAWLPKEGSEGAFRAARLASSQVGQIGTLQTSQYLQSRALGQPYDPLDPNFWATQIPFTALDIVHASTGKIPKVADLEKARVVKPVEKPYEPPTKASEDATVAATLEQMQRVLSDDTATPEMKEAVVAAALNVSLEPKVGVALKQPATEDVSPVTGYARKMINGNYKVLVPDDEGGDKTVFVNGVEPTTNPDGTVTFAAKPSQVKASVTSPLTRRDFGISRPGEAELPVQPKEWAGFPPDMQRTLEEHGAPTPAAEMPEDVRAQLRSDAEKLQQAHEQIATTKATIASVPQTAEEITPLITPPSPILAAFRDEQGNIYSGGLGDTHLHVAYANALDQHPPGTLKRGFIQNGEWLTKEQAAERGKALQARLGLTGTPPDGEAFQLGTINMFVKRELDKGATPTQAVEQARLVAQTPQLDEALRQLAVTKAKVQSEWKGKPQAIYGEAVRDANGQNFKTKELAEAYRESDPDLKDHVVRNAGKDKGFYLAPQINKEVSLEGTQLEKVLEVPATIPGEVEPQNRPEVSFRDAIASLDRAVEEPQVLARVLGLDPNEPLDVIQATKYAKQAREIYRQTEGGKPLDLVEVNKALKAQGSTPIADEGRAQRILQIVGAGIDEFNGRYRNWTIESDVPHDEALVQKTGIREGGLPAVLDWFSKKEGTGLVGTLAGDLKKAVPNLDKVLVTYNQREGWRYFEHGPDVQRINIPYLPNEATADDWALNVTHEIAHFASKDLLSRNDPAAVRFKATLVDVLNALKNSKELPQSVRDAVALSSKNGWYRDFSATGDGKLLHERWINAVGKENADWFQVFYGLQNPEELLSQTFGSRKMVQLMQDVRMPKTLKDTVLQYFSRAWNAIVGGGKPLTDSALERVLLGFNDYLSGPKIGPRTLNIRSELSAGENFLYGLAAYDPERRLLGGKHPIPKDGKIDVGTLKNIGGVGKPLQDGEIELYKSIVPEAFGSKAKDGVVWDNGSGSIAPKATVVNVPKLVEGLKTKGPVVEVKKLGQEEDSSLLDTTRRQVTDLERKQTQIQHEIETEFAGYTLRGGTLVGPEKPFQSGPEVVFNRIGSPENEARYQALPKELRNLHEEYVNLKRQAEDLIDSQDWEHVGGREASYSGIAPKTESEMPGYVEGLVRVPLPIEKTQHPTLSKVREQRALYRGPHFGSEDTNVLAFFRGYEETLPDGTKAFHVIEVQSDWGQQERDNLAKIKAGTHYKEQETGHPLLKVYESLALKAAIAHAKEVGATKVILSDAETAMMTEGHDRQTNTRYFPTKEKAEKFLAESKLLAPNYRVAEDRIDSWQIVENPTGAEHEKWQIKIPISQEGGMRLHYDQTLPSAMEKLTGETGKPVSIGVHKAAAETGYRVEPPERGGNIIYKGSPVFRDASGQPKTQITGQEYDITKTPEKVPLFEPKTPSTTVRQSVPYNARDFIRDSLVANGVRPEALASRVQSIEQTFANGDLGASIAGFEREAQNGTLPATAVAGPLNEGVKTALQTGVPQDIYHGTMNLLADEVPQHADLWWQMKQDVDVATQLYGNIKKGLVPGELPVNAKENLALANVKLNAMRRALVKYSAALERFNQLANFTLDGMENTFGQVLEGRSLPGPPDPTGLEPEAQDLLGLKRATTSRGELEKGMSQRAWDWVNRNLMLTQHAKQLIPGVRPVVDHVQQEQGDAFTRMTRLNFVRGYNPETGALDRKLIDTTRRVEQNASLSKAASDIRRWINVQNKEGKKWSMDDTFVKEVLGRSGDPKAVLAELQSEFRRWEDFNDQIVPQFLAKLNNRTTAYLIAARETGMKPDVARDLSGQMYDALGMLKQQETAPYGMETLRMLATKMQPDTYLKALQMSRELIDASEKHIAFRKSTPVYTSEQRFDKHHIVMMTPDGKPYRASFETRDAAMEKIAANEKAGYKYLDYIPKSDANVAGKLNDDLIASMKELDLQTATRLAEYLKDKPDLYAQVLPMTQRASDYDSSQAAFTSIPGGTVRKFVAGREGINMVTNSNLMYSRYNNWMRHKLVRAESDLDMLDPDLMSNRASMQYARQHVENQLASDNQLTRKLVQGTYYWKLAWNFGVNVLHGIQSLTTGMTQMIAESGGVGDAFKLTGGAQKAMIQRMVTGKWDSAEHKWLADKLVSQGHAGIASWADIYGDQLVTMREAAHSTNPLIKAGGLVQKAADSWTGMFLKFNDLVGSFAAFDLAKERGMTNEDAFNYAVDVKNRAYFTGGKAQRAVGLWGIKTKPVPQLMSSLQIYTFGWFSQLASNWQRGFGRPPVELSFGERVGAKKAFLYQLGVQAVLAGAVGLPGVGQGMALIKQATGTDPKAWLRQHMGELFGEDQDNGGMMTALALHGLVAAATPLDPSGRHIPTFPFTGVSPYKGFDVANLASAPVSAASDIVKGLLAAAKGDVQGASTLLPHVLSGPYQLWQGEGDVRDKGGNLITKLSPAERFVTALGMTPSRVSTLKDANNAAKQASTLAAQEKSATIDRMASIYRRQGPQAGQRELVSWIQQHPGEDARSLVRAIAGRVTAQTTPVDWRRNVNVAADLSGLTSRMPSTELQRVQGQSDIAASLGLPQRLSGREVGMASRLDELMNSDPYLTRAEAIRSLTRPRRVPQLLPAGVPPEYQ